MRPLLPASLLLTALVAAPAAPAADAATKVRKERVQIQITTSARVDPQIGFIPIKGIDRAAGKQGTPATGNGRRFRLFWDNVTLPAETTTLGLRTLREENALGPSINGVVADRALTTTERQRFRVATRIGYDADVLVVATGHPACAGLTRAQARDIATGAVARWSQVGALAPGNPDEIVRRAVALNGVPQVIEPRLGLPRRTPAGVIADRDGGAFAAATGDPAVAGITSWSRARLLADRLCVVPLDGVAPTDAAVLALSYGEAYPIDWVVGRTTPKDALSRAASKAFVAFLRSPAARAAFRKARILMPAGQSG